MIKIEMSFESGAQAREEMLRMLGTISFQFERDARDETLSLQERRALTTGSATDFGAVEDRAVAAALVSGEIRDEPAATEPAKRTRRTKAQIAADEAAERAAKECDPSQDTGPATDAVDVSDAVESTATAEPDEGEDPSVPPSAAYAHRAAEYLAANPGTTPLQHMKAELTKVNDKFGLDEVRKLMVGFGIPRIAEVPVEQYPALLAAVDKRLAA